MKGPLRVLGICKERLFIFRELGSNGFYFREAAEQANSFRDLASPAQKLKNRFKVSDLKRKSSIKFYFSKILWLGPHPPDPPF